MSGKGLPKDIDALMEESINLELRVSELYILYSDLFEADRAFWWQLALEEKNHAALLKSSRLFQQIGKLPVDLLLDKLTTLRTVGAQIEEHLRRYRATPPDRGDAYHYALALEKSAAEAHFQKVMTGTADTKVLSILQGLAGEDLDHARRIQSLLDMREKGQ